MKKLLILFFLSFSISFAMKLEKGPNLVIVKENVTNILNKSWSKYILKIYGTKNGSYTSFDPNDIDFSDFTSLEAGKGYIVIVNKNIDISDFEIPTNISENCISLVKGANIVALPSIDLTKKNSINGAKILKIYGTKNGSYTSFDPNDIDFSDFTSTEAGKAYIVIVGNNSNPVNSCENNTSVQQSSNIVPPSPESNTSGSSSSSTNDLFPPQVPNVQ